MPTQFLPVHMMEMDRSTSRLELVGINPTVTFAIAGANGSAFYTYQLGEWFDSGLNWMPEANVPPEIVEQCRANPPVVTATGPNVTEVCKFCGEKLNQSAMNQHYIQHVESTLQAAGTAAADEAIPPAVEDLKPKRRE